MIFGRSIRPSRSRKPKGVCLSFEGRWDDQYAVIGKTWRRHWAGITPLFAYPAEIRRSIYTTNIVESLHMTLRKVIKTRGSFPSEEAALKLLYLALKNVRKRWQATRDWKPSLNHFTLLWGDRIEAAWQRPYLDDRALASGLRGPRK